MEKDKIARGKSAHKQREMVKKEQVQRKKQDKSEALRTQQEAFRNVKKQREIEVSDWEQQDILRLWSWTLNCLSSIPLVASAPPTICLPFFFLPLPFPFSPPPSLPPSQPPPPLPSPNHSKKPPGPTSARNTVEL